MRIRACGLWIGVCVVAVSTVGCLDRELTPVNPCLVSGVLEKVRVANVDEVDLLFMVDNSGSMREEQALLAREFPDLIRILATGDVNADGVEEFRPVRDLHLGVVTSDMGLPGIASKHCSPLSAPGPRDGRLVTRTANLADKPDCREGYPKFLSFNPERDDSEDIVQRFTCLATVGGGGCPFEQQLEAVLKALAPADLRADVSGDAQPELVRFLDDSGKLDAVGHGGTGHNAGFLREDALLGVIVVTDEEDCSSHDVGHWEQKLPEDSPIRRHCREEVVGTDGINARCACPWVKENHLWPIKRYVNGLKALKPENEDLVMFATISGVPKTLVDDASKRQFNNLKEPEDREAYYRNILTHPRLQEIIEPQPGKGHVVRSSCTTPAVDGGDEGGAAPPRRLVEVARRFGANGVVESICNDSFSGALDSIIAVIERILNDVCLPRELQRDIDGMVSCDVIWEMPAPSGDLTPGTPTRCEDREFLSPPPPDRPQRTRDGRARCVVPQIPVRDRNGDGSIGEEDRPNEEEAGTGWFYDDFTAEVEDQCATEGTPQRILFTDGAQPPTGANVRLECINEVQSISEIAQHDGPTLGDVCEPTTSRGCGRAAPGCRGGDDEALCCHPTFAACVRRCTSDTDCPAAWVCDARLETQTSAGLPGGGEEGICVNPTCGD